MNLRGIANALTQAVNPNISASLQVCIGNVTAADFSREPLYAPAVDCIVQAQSLTKKEIEHLDALNLSNATQAVYANVQLTGVDRVEQSGGDLLTYADPMTGNVRVWLVIAVLEAWGGEWCKVAVAKQTDAVVT